MTRILDLVAQSRGRFVPEDWRQYVALQLAKRLQAVDEIHKFISLVDQHSFEDVANTYRHIGKGIPNEPLPPVGTLGFRIPLYGFRKWRDVFTSRQLLALGVFVTHTRQAIELVRRETPFFAEVVGAYLGILFGRFVNYMSNLCIWDPAAGEVKQTFSRYALPMNWDFAEANPLSESDRYYAGGMEVAAKAIASLLAATKMNVHHPDVRRRSSVTSSFTQQQIIFTDPPYY